MKFLCPSCKAKYQIADEKVAGRAVRMKCRKCGHIIQVSSIAGVGDALLGSEPPAAIDAAKDAPGAQDVAAPPAPATKSEPRPAAQAPSKPEQKVEVKKPQALPARPSVTRSLPVARGPLPAPKP